MFKKVFNVLYYMLPDILLIVLFSMWVQQFTDYIREYGSIKEFEYGLFAVTALIFYRLYTNVNKCVKASRKFRIIFAIGTALCYTIALWFLNSYWLYLHTNSRLPFVLMSYKDMLWSNLTYTYSWGEWRYPLAFALMLILCLLLPWVKEKLKPIGEYIGEYIFEKFLNLLSEEETTSSTIADYLYHKNALISWYLNVPKTPEAKDELKQYAFEADEMLLYGLLIAHFADQMTEEEYDSVIEKYARFLIIQTSPQTGENEGSEVL